MADSDDSATDQALLPDWGKKVTLTQIWDTNVTRSFAGKEQRSAKRVRPTFRLEYFRSGLTALEARRRLQAIRGEFEGPLIVPIWPDGVVLDGNMTTPISDDTIPIGTNLPQGYSVGDKVFLWDAATGGEFRTLLTIEDGSLTVSGSSTLYTTGAFCFPCLKAIREPDSEAINSIDVEAGTEKVRYLTL